MLSYAEQRLAEAHLYWTDSGSVWAADSYKRIYRNVELFLKGHDDSASTGPEWFGYWISVFFVMLPDYWISTEYTESGGGGPQGPPGVLTQPCLLETDLLISRPGSV